MIILKCGTTPCLDCEKRTLGCHSNCEDYLNFRKEIDEKNKIAFQKNEDKNNYREYLKNSKKKYQGG